MKLQFISSSRAKQIQRSFQSFRLTILCGVLTLLVLRGTLGAGKFGTPAQDFEEIKSRFKRAHLHRKQFKFASRVLSEVGMKRKPTMDSVENGAEVARNDAIMGQNEGIQLQNYAETLEKLVESVRSGVESARNDEKSAGKDAKSVPNNAGFDARMAGLQPTLQENRLGSEISSRQSGRLHVTKRSRPRMMLIIATSGSSSGASRCNDVLLKSAENRLHYCRIHGTEVSYKAVESWPEGGISSSFQAELLRGMMLAEPEVEWIWWMDREAFITDMGFEIPVERYEDHNLVLLSEEDDDDDDDDDDEAADLGIQKLDMVGSSFLIRNCRWSLDILGEIHADPSSSSSSAASASASSALLHDLLARLQHKEQEKVLIESSHHHHHHHQHHQHHHQGRDRSQDLDMEGSDDESAVRSWPFITRCKPCDQNQNQNQKDAGDAAMARCFQLMERALDFAH